MTNNLPKEPYRKQRENPEEDYQERVQTKQDVTNQKVPSKIYIEKQRISQEIPSEKGRHNRILSKITQKIVEHQATDLEPLKTVGRKITGNLFDRVEFLRMRMNELEISLGNRESLHVKLMEEIEKDVKDREKMLERITNPEDMREHKLDISLLKMEKRKEEMLHWRDITNLRKELQEAYEEYQNEMKIANLFSELNLPK